MPKEATTIELPPMPNPVGFRHWRTAVREAVAAAATDPQQAFAWVQLVEQPTSSFNSLADSQGQVTLDAKLAAALTKIISGEFATQVVAFKEAEAGRGNLLKGRQLLFKLYEYFGIHETEDRIINLESLVALQLQGDDLRGF